eukprot:EG_transcript_15519
MVADGPPGRAAAEGCQGRFIVGTDGWACLVRRDVHSVGTPTPAPALPRPVPGGGHQRGTGDGGAAANIGDAPIWMSHHLGLFMNLEIKINGTLASTLFLAFICSRSRMGLV